MPHEIPTKEPTELRAGDNWEWDKVLADFLPSDGWTLKYALRGEADIEITAGDDGDRTHQVRKNSAATAAAEPGSYQLVGYVEKASDRHTVYEATVLVRPNPANAVNAKSHAKTTLDLIEAAIEGRIPKDRESFSINGRQVSHIPMAELARLRDRYRVLVYLEQNPDGPPPSREVHFVAAG